MIKSDPDLLQDWYLANKRQLPWRENRDPYRIWLSETMLQQTTTTAVLGYYDRFLAKFNSLEKLASAPLEEIYQLWAGLGYYSRARNLHKAAKLLVQNGRFPRTHKELLEYPGFGPYTARAVSSLAFSEAVGVLDGNVIRVFSRKENLNLEWWRPKVRDQLQKLVDRFVVAGESALLNQALMELGSQICTPKNPHCKMCPWMNSCKSFKAKTTHLRPLKKPRRKNEIWVWAPEIRIHNGAICLQKNNYTPFLRNSWILPGKAKLTPDRPKRYDFRHSITHHDIFVQLPRKAAKIKIRGAILAQNRKGDERWVKLQDLQKVATSSLIKKAIEYANKISN